MKLFLLAVIAVICLSSCSKYQCLVISSDNAVQNTRKEFVEEADSFSVVYSFHNPYGNVGVSVYNKSDKGLQVDWARSFVIIGGDPVPFWTPEVKISGELERSTGLRASVINATASHPEALQFIPPQSNTRRNGLSLARSKFFTTDMYKFSREKVEAGGFKKRIKRARLKKDDSPVQFRVYLTILPYGATEANPVIIDKSFYVSDIIQTRSDADEIFPGNQHGNMVIMSKFTFTGTVLALGVTTGALVLLSN